MAEKIDLENSINNIFVKILYKKKKKIDNIKLFSKNYRIEFYKIAVLQKHWYQMTRKPIQIQLKTRESLLGFHVFAE